MFYMMHKNNNIFWWYAMALLLAVSFSKFLVEGLQLENKSAWIRRVSAGYHPMEGGGVSAGYHPLGTSSSSSSSSSTSTSIGLAAFNEDAVQGRNDHAEGANNERPTTDQIIVGTAPSSTSSTSGKTASTSNINNQES